MDADGYPPHPPRLRGRGLHRDEPAEEVHVLRFQMQQLVPPKAAERQYADHGHVALQEEGAPCLLSDRAHYPPYLLAGKGALVVEFGRGQPDVVEWAFRDVFVRPKPLEERLERPCVCKHGRILYTRDDSAPAHDALPCLEALEEEGQNGGGYVLGFVDLGHGSQEVRECVAGDLERRGPQAFDELAFAHVVLEMFSKCFHSYSIPCTMPIYMGTVWPYVQIILDACLKVRTDKRKYTTKKPHCCGLLMRY